MTKQMNDSKLGALLRYAEILEEQDIKRGLVLSQYTGLPLGRSLVLLGCVSAEMVRSSVQVQSLIRDGLLEPKIAKRALHLVQRQDWTLAEAFSALGVDQLLVRENRLGDLLMSARFIQFDELELALYVNEQSSLPLGYILAMLGKAAPAKLKLALSLQTEIRAGRIDRIDAVQRIKDLRDKNVGNADRNEVFLGIGQLLVQASVIADFQLQQALEASDEIDRMTALILIDLGLLTRELLVATIRLQELVATGSINASQAAAALSRIYKTGFCSTTALDKEQSEGFTLCFEDFLIKTGYLDSGRLNRIVDEVIDRPELTATVLKHLMSSPMHSYDGSRKAIECSFKDSNLFSELLRNCTSVDKELINSAIVLYELYREGQMRIDQAAISFSLQAELSTTRKNGKSGKRSDPEKNNSPQANNAGQAAQRF